MDKYKQTAGLLVILGCLLWLLPVPVVQAAPQDLYESEVTVPDQTPGVRENALRSALAEVLVRVAGKNSVLTTEPAKAMLDKPAQLVQQYRYFTRPGSQPPVLTLWVRFDGTAIRQALQDQGQAVWGRERPDTLVWLAVEDRGKRYVVSSGGDSEVQRQVDRAARQRGVPILFPLMDLEDQSKVRFSDIWGGFFDNVILASERYNPPAVLIGRLNRSPSGGWSSRWYLQVAGKQSAWSDSRKQLDILAQQGIDDMADILASRFSVAQTGGRGDRMRISVAGVDTLAAYARVSAYLAALTSVSDLQVDQVSGSDVRFSLALKGRLEDLTRTVRIGSVLETAPDGGPGNYRLRQ